MTDSQGEPTGKVIDLLFDLTSSVTAVIIALPNRDSAIVDWLAVEAVTTEELVLALPGDEVVGRSQQAGELSVARDLLDKEVVDARESRVYRVNDVVLGEGPGTLRIASLDVGTSGLISRSGLLPLAERIAAVLHREMPEHLLPWDALELEPTASEGLRIRARADWVADLHAADIADLAENMQRDAATALLQSLDDETMADTLEELAPNVLATFLSALDPDRAAEVLDRMSPDKAADALATVDEEVATRILAQMEQRRAAVSSLMRHDPHTAGGRMTTEMICVPEEMTVGQALAVLRAQASRVEMFYYVYLVDPASGRLQGVVSLRQLLTSAEDLPLAEIAERNVVTVRPEDQDQDVAREIAKYDLLAIPVVDEEKRLQGIVTVDDALESLLPSSWRDRLPRIL